MVEAAELAQPLEALHLVVGAEELGVGVRLGRRRPDRRLAPLGPREDGARVARPEPVDALQAAEHARVALLQAGERGVVDVVVDLGVVLEQRLLLRLLLVGDRHVLRHVERLAHAARAPAAHQPREPAPHRLEHLVHPEEVGDRRDREEAVLGEVALVVDVPAGRRRHLLAELDGLLQRLAVRLDRGDRERRGRVLHLLEPARERLRLLGRRRLDRDDRAVAGREGVGGGGGGDHRRGSGTTQDRD